MQTVKINEQQKEWAIKAGAGIAALVFFYAVMIQPVFSDIAILHKSITDSGKRIALFREAKDLRASLAGFERNLAVLTDRSSLLGKISDIAGQTKLDFETLTPRTEPEGAYTRLKIEAEGKGSFFSLLKFLEAIEKSSTAIKVRDVSLLKNISETSPKNKNFLQIHLVFETFLKQRSKKNNA